MVYGVLSFQQGAGHAEWHVFGSWRFPRTERSNASAIKNKRSERDGRARLTIQTAIHDQRKVGFERMVPRIYGDVVAYAGP